MSDLIVAGFVLTLLSLGTFLLGLRIGRRPQRVAQSAALVIVVSIFAYLALGRDAVAWAAVLPVSSLVLLSNPVLPGTGFLAGLAWRTTPGNSIRRAIPCLAILAIGVFATVHPLLGQPPFCNDNWQGDVCLQTSESSCSAAAAVTLLRDYGIESNEREMADLCLTRRGTTWMGLYRGLKLKTAGTPYDVAVFQGSVEPLRDLLPGPVIVAVGIPKSGQAPAIYSDEWGWTPGLMHSVLLYEPVGDDRITVADPSIGREQWSSEDLRILWRGPALYLVKR